MPTGYTAIDPYDIFSPKLNVRYPQYPPALDSIELPVPRALSGDAVALDSVEFDRTKTTWQYYTVAG